MQKLTKYSAIASPGIFQAIAKLKRELNINIELASPQDFLPLLPGWRDIRDLGLQGKPDREIYQAAALRDAIIITRDKGFIFERSWPAKFTAGVIFVNLPDNTPAKVINAKITELLAQRLPISLILDSPVFDASS